MGGSISSETLSISGGDGHRYWVGLNMKPSHVGCKKTVYKGVLLGNGPRQWEKVVAKAFSSIPGTKDAWRHEVSKADLTKQLAAKFIQDYSPPCKIRVVIPGIVQMDRVSNVNKWLAGKSGGRGLTRDEWLSIEELIPGRIDRFCPWSAEHLKDCAESKNLQAFSHFTYMQTNGALVACDFQGTCDQKDSSAKYIFTDSIIHSTYQMCGIFDKGEYGITEFFKFHKCTELCRDWPLPTPLTPPPSFEEASRLHCRLTPPPAFENIVFPAQSNELLSNGNHTADEHRDWERRRHTSERHRRRALEAPEARAIDTLDVHWLPQRRRRSFSNVGRDDESGQEQVTCPLPFYGDPRISPARDDSLPPAYDTVVQIPVTAQSSNPDTLPRSEGGERLETGDVSARRSPSPRLFGGSLKQLKNGKERSLGYDEMRRPRNSATDSEVEQRQADGNRKRSCSDAPRSPSLRERRLQTQASARGEDNCGSVFHSGDMEAALPPLVVPSAPPLEDENSNGT